MRFHLEMTREFEKNYNKKSKKNPEIRKAGEKKLKQILDNPYKFKPLHKPLQNFKRVHILKCFVLIYVIKEQTVILTKFDHHDKAYK
ncbi:MAG: type II toxin-antitoxin system RelE/ParE family toxin [archaeon]